MTTADARGSGARREPWPALPFASWQQTKDTLHMWTQVVGKVKVQLSPFLNEWWHVAFLLRPRGLTTGPVPYPPGASEGTFAVDFDFVDHNLRIETSEGGAKALPLVARSVADFYGEFMASLRALGVDVTINTTPDEVEVRIPFEQDREHASYDRESVERWWQIMVQASRALEAHRSPFAGKSSPVQFFWGSFNLAYTRFSGKPCDPPPGAGLLMRVAEDQENIAAGFWPGGGTLDGPAYYCYAHPKPEGLENAAIRPAAAHWDAGIGEFILPYDDVRKTASPEGAIREFLQSTYEAAADLAGWDRSCLEQPPPERGS